MRIAFVCIQNAGRSQVATAFAERERSRRGLEDEIDVVTGGTRPADAIHDEVLSVMAETGVDLSDRTPRTITPDELRACDYVVAMGCSAAGVCPATWSDESRDWDLEDPHGRDVEWVRELRDEIERRVERLFDEVTAAHGSGN